MSRGLHEQQIAEIAALTFDRFVNDMAEQRAADRAAELEAIEVYPCMLEWGTLAMQLRDLGVSNRDIAFAIALAERAP